MRPLRFVFDTGCFIGGSGVILQSLEAKWRSDDNDTTASATAVATTTQQLTQTATLTLTLMLTLALGPQPAATFAIVAATTLTLCIGTVPVAAIALGSLAAILLLQPLDALLAAALRDALAAQQLTDTLVVLALQAIDTTAIALLQLVLAPLLLGGATQQAGSIDGQGSWDGSRCGRIASVGEHKVISIVVIIIAVIHIVVLHILIVILVIVIVVVGTSNGIVQLIFILLLASIYLSIDAGGTACCGCGRAR